LWHLTTFPVVLAGLGVLALAAGLMLGGMRSDGATPADTQPARTTSAPVVADSRTATGTPSPTAAATEAGAALARSTPQPTADATPRHSPTQAPSGQDNGSGSGSGDDGVHLPTVHLPTFH
jgi:hypothetical protein